MAQTTTQCPTDRAQQRAKYLSDFLWHVGAFVIINGFFWVLDLTLGQLEDRRAKRYRKQDEAD